MRLCTVSLKQAITQRVEVLLSRHYYDYGKEKWKLTNFKAIYYFTYLTVTALYRVQLHVLHEKDIKYYKA